MLWERVFYLRHLFFRFTFCIGFTLLHHNFERESQAWFFIGVVVNLWRGNQETRHIPLTTLGIIFSELITSDCPKFCPISRLLNSVSKFKKAGYVSLCIWEGIELPPGGFKERTRWFVAANLISPLFPLSFSNVTWIGNDFCASNMSCSNSISTSVFSYCTTILVASTQTLMCIGVVANTRKNERADAFIFMIVIIFTRSDCTNSNSQGRCLSSDYYQSILK